MNLSSKISSSFSLIKVKLFKNRAPVIVKWALTYRCNRACRYCGANQAAGDELDTGEIFSIIDEMSEMNTKVIHFTGGESLIRDDIGQILDYCGKKQISTGLNSNGSLVPDKMRYLGSLGLLSLSLDGPEEIHDSIRGKGSYKEVMLAIKHAQINNIKIRITTVISKINLESIDFILNKAKELKIIVVFQPATRLLLNSDGINPIAPLGEKYKSVINKLINDKKRNKFIGNSLSGLKHLYSWPSLKAIACVNGLVLCRVEPDGRLYGCADFRDKINMLNCKNEGFKRAFMNLVPMNCKECWCASNVELNCLLALKFNTVLNILKFA